MDESFAGRYLNEGFSGGEKKRNEMLQMAVLKPKFAVLDETDSGLDIDALQVVAKAVNSLRGPDFGAVVITHYHRILDHIKPDVVHILMGGRIVKTGGPELAMEIEKRGYDWIRVELGLEDEAVAAQGVK
jgi:Fe-S cluster assembly ATP-binding protein